MRSLIKLLAAVGVLLVSMLTITSYADAHRLRCGSSWELCAQRGKGPAAKQGVVPRGNQLKQQQR
jgi:hypothetical protein